MSYPQTLRVGESVPGTKWVMRGLLGQGGMGVVLDVVKEPGIRAAMKVMRPGFARSPEFVARFLDEARVLVELRHPNIVQVIDCDTLADGSPFVVMERLEGRTLRAAARDLAESGRRLTAKNIWEVARQVCEGLYRAHTHEPPVVHRDVKPDNLFLHQPEYGEPIVKLIDFGIAAVVGAAGHSPDGLLGTPRYMSPEVLRGDAVSAQSDLYSAALVVYELLTLHFPWDVNVRHVSEVATAHLTLPPAPPSRFAPWIPKSVDECLLRALSKDPKERPRDVYELSRKLFELQIADDGSAHFQLDAHTTAPTLGTLALGGSARQPSSDAAVERGSGPHPSLAITAVGVEVDDAPTAPGGPAPEAIGPSDGDLAFESGRDAALAVVPRPRREGRDRGERTTEGGRLRRGPQRAPRVLALALALGISAAAALGVGARVTLERGARASHRLGAPTWLAASAAAAPSAGEPDPVLPPFLRVPAAFPLPAAALAPQPAVDPGGQKDRVASGDGDAARAFTRIAADANPSLLLRAPDPAERGARASGPGAPSVPRVRSGPPTISPADRPVASAASADDGAELLSVPR